MSLRSRTTTSSSADVWEPPARRDIVHPRYEAVARHFFDLFGSDGGGALVVRRRGETVLDISAGFCDRARRRPWNRETAALGFSATKGIAATVVHRLADRGLIDYDRPVADYWPAFAAHGKSAITIRDVLSHRAGLYSIRAIATRAEDMLDHEEMEQRLAAAAPERGPCPPAYHAFTFGWLMSGLARQITGAGMAELIHSELGIDGMYLGASRSSTVEVAELTGTQIQLLGRTAILAPVIARGPGARRAIDALAVPGVHRLLDGRTPPLLAAEMPAGSGLFTAASLANLYGALANGGLLDDRRLLSAATVARLSEVQTERRDRVMGLRVRWRLGYHQAVSFGCKQPKAFGHYGYGGSGGWADPTTGLSLGFVTNKIGWRTTPIGDARLFRLTGLTLAAESGPAR